MPLNDIVNVVITRQTQTVSEAGFGIPMILGTSNHFNELIKYYSSIDEVAQDFSSSDPEYIASQDIFSQEISPVKIAIGRRQVDDVTIDVQTAMTGEDYTVIINDTEINVLSTSANTYSVVTLNNDLVAGNKIDVQIENTGLGTTTSVIDFDIDFVALNSILATVNGVALAPVVFNTDQATTIADLATAIGAVAEVASATVTGARQITVLFNAVGTNKVNSVVTTLGATQPQATIVQGGFTFDTSTAKTMQNIADQILIQFPTFTATVSPLPSRILTVQAPIGVNATVNSFTVTGGATQATATITNPLQPVEPETVASDIVDAINNESLLNPAFPVNAIDNGDGTFTLTNKVDGTPYTVKVKTSIGSVNSALVKITQVLPNASYRVTLNGQDFTFVTDNSIQNATQIIDNLVSLINAQPQKVFVMAENIGNASFEIISDDPINTFSISVSPEIMSYQKGLVVLPLIPSNPVSEDLDAINNQNSDWYALISTSRDFATVKAIADWVEPRIKLFGTASNDQAIINVQAGIDTSSIASVLNQGGYIRTFVMYHQDADFDYPEGAWFGRVLPLESGSETWKFKTLRGISYSNLTTTQSNNALNKKANTYEYVGGVGITANGTVAGGEYIDIIRGIDWLTAKIQEFVFALLVNNEKVPYTDAGIASIQAEVKRALALGVANDFLSDNPAPICTVPLAVNVPTADKANRILRNVKFQATLAGAIHAVEIRGMVSV